MVYLGAMKVSDIAAALEAFAPLSLQEDYDNAGLLVGNRDDECRGVLCCLDVTQPVVKEAVQRGCNMIVAHHPIIFRGIKKMTGTTEPERVVIDAVRNNVAIYAAHTNIDNVIDGVNARIADQLELTERTSLVPKTGILKKLYTFVPPEHLEKVRMALFDAGAGVISKYSECSFTHEGTGTFRPGEGTDPFSGEIGKRQNEQEIKLEVILPGFAEARVLQALFASHPYEEVAYDLVSLANAHQGIGSGLLGHIPGLDEENFLRKLRSFNNQSIRHTPFVNRPIRRVAVCGGAGSFLIGQAIKAGADAYVTADLKYHDFFTAEGRILVCDIGHFESEQFTIDLFVDILVRKFPNFAVLKSGINTNPVQYYTGQ